MRSNSEVASRENAKFNRPKRKFRIRRIIVAKRVSNEEKKKPKMQSCDMCYIHHNVGSFGRHYFVFVYIIPLLIGLLQVDYQSKQKSPFQTHAPNMWIFLVATCIYCLGLSTKMELQNHHRRNNTQIIIGYVNLSSGALSSIALVSIFLPRWLGWFCLGSWTILPIMQARRFVNQKNHIWLKRSIVKITSLARGRFNRFRGYLRRSLSAITRILWAKMRLLEVKEHFCGSPVKLISVSNNESPQRMFTVRVVKAYRDS